MDRHSAYVAFTRHRDHLAVYYDQETFRSRYHLDKTLSRDAARTSPGLRRGDL